NAIGFALGLDLLTFVVGAALAGALLGLAGSWLPVPPELRWQAFALTLVWLIAARSTPTGILRLHDRYAQGAAADSTTSIVRIIGATIAALFAPTINAFLLVWAVAELATAATYWRFALRQRPCRCARSTWGSYRPPKRGRGASSGAPGWPGCC